MHVYMHILLMNEIVVLWWIKSYIVIIYFYLLLQIVLTKRERFDVHSIRVLGPERDYHQSYLVISYLSKSEKKSHVMRSVLTEARGVREVSAEKEVLKFSLMVRYALF